MRIAIVNDMVMAREALRRVVQSGPGHSVAWMAANGAEAIERARSDRPDLILMDLMMPVLNGVEATRRIMAEAPCPIVIVTSTVGGHMSKVFEAMGHGALDAVETPTLGTGDAVNGAGAVLDKIATIAMLIGATTAKARSSPPRATSEGATPRTKLVLLGASTGGPNALAVILAGLPESWDACVIMVQHLDTTFCPSLARWLGERTGRRVDLIADGDQPAPGRWLLAGTNDHLHLDARRRLVYSAEPKAVCYRPSVDVFYSSVANHWVGSGVAALLTGMGRDGAEGMLALRRKGWHTIAQDEPTSIVYGMPRAAVEVGAAAQILPVSEIARAIVSAVEGRRGG